MLGPGVTAEEVHAAYAETIQTEGYPYPTFRCGRGTGFSFLEEPQLVVGNKTVLQPGMVFAVDGGATTNAAIGSYFPGFSFPGASGAANNKQGVAVGAIFSATDQAKIQITGTGSGGTGSAEGYIWYHVIDDGAESA